MKRLLITGAWQYTQEQHDALTRMGYKICFVQKERDVLQKEAYDAEYIICNGLFLYHNIENFKQLKTIQLTSAGYDRVPLDYIKEHNITIYNARGVYSIPMAEYAVSGVLNLYKKSRFFYENQKQQKWEKSRNLIELHNKQVLIVGAGNVGTECAQRFTAFGANVRGVDLYPRVDSAYEQIVHLQNLQEEVSKADIIVLTLPLSDKTKGLFDKTIFDAMQMGTIIVNIARGAIIDTDAMIEALKKHRLGGAVIDVFDTEPLDIESPLWAMENVIITPHNSFVGDGNSMRLWELIVRNLERN